MTATHHIPKWSPAEITGLAAIIFAALIFTTAPGLAILSLSSFLFLCFIAPFLPRFGFFLPVIHHGGKGVTAVALTFDDGPSPASTPDILRLLNRYKLKATFFVIGRQAAAYPELIGDIIAGGHSIANHSYRHDSLLMLRSYAELQRDIEKTQEILARFGIKPLLFRPPAGVTNPRLKGVTAALNLTTVNFSCRAFDGGNKRINNLTARVMNRLRPGDIIMLHDTCPRPESLKQYWLTELDQLFKNMRQKYTVLPLENIIYQPVMSLISGAENDG